MSAKQAVIVTFMIVFLGGTLFGIGAWVHYRSQLDMKARTKEILEERKRTLERVINGTATDKGLVMQEGELQNELEAAKKKVEGVIGDASSGVTQRKTLYGEKEAELNAKRPAAEAKWKALYEEWRTLNKNIQEAQKKLKDQAAEKETRTAEAQAELERELATERTEVQKIGEERKKTLDEIAHIRYSHEQVLEKVSEVSRETRKARTIEPQGQVIHADNALKLVTVNAGRDRGIRKGLRFDVYAGALASLVKKGVIEITAVDAASADAIIVPAKTIQTVDPITGWVPTDPRMKYSIFTAGGADETSAVELIKPKTKQERIEAYRLEKLEREMGPEARDDYLRQRQAPSAPPIEQGIGIVGIVAGDWINNPDFVPIVPESAYQKAAVNELLDLRDVSLSSLVFHFADSLRPYRKEFLRRLVERNRCRVADAMGPNVNYVVSAPGWTSAEMLQEKLEPTKDKEEVAADIKNMRTTLAALQEARKAGAGVMSDDELEGFFAKRQRKAELIRGKTVQPGRSTFFVAGETRQRSVTETQAFIKANGGVTKGELDASVDYVVVGMGVDAAYLERIKKIGCKVIREDELPRFFGLE
jgi:NAD-dependent DNA ligase